jgi:membrane protein
MPRLPDWLRLPDTQEMARATHVSRMALRSLLSSRMPQMAAALAYRTLFGLLPIGIVALVIVRMFVGDDDLRRLVEQAIRFTGIAEVVQTEINEATSEQDDEQAAASLFAMLDSIMFLPDPGMATMPARNARDVQGVPAPEPDATSSPTADQPDLSTVDGIVETIITRFAGVRFNTIGLVGGLVLIYAGLAMIVEVERCFNQICHAKSGRSWVRRITQYWTLMTLGAILIALTFLVGVQFREWVSSMAGEGDAFGRFIVGAAGFLVTVAISTGLLTLAYMILPNRRLRLRPVLAGASVAAVGWEAAKWGFTQYLGFATGSGSTYANVYGSIALVPLFMLWIFLTWLIILFGLQVAYGVQMLEDGIPQEDDGDEPSLLLAGPGVMIDAAVAIARRFESGSGARNSDVADELALASDQSARIIDTLQRAGFVRQLDNGGGFTLSRPADKIRLADIAASATSAAASREGSAAAELARAAVKALGDATLHSRVVAATATPASADGVSKSEATCSDGPQPDS